MPGIDETSSHATLEEAEWLTPKTVEQSAARRQTGAMAELFALGHCDLFMARRRQMIRLAALHGVDHCLVAPGLLDTRANAIKQEYFDPFRLDQPLFDGVPGISPAGRLCLIAGEVPEARYQERPFSEKS